MKHLSFYLTVFLAVVFAVPAFAGGGNGAPSGPHYNLNLIGMEKGKYPDMTNSNRHTIFIALNNQAGSNSKIYLTPGEFQVCDGNGYDAAWDCDGNQVGASGAVFQLPCNINIPADITCGDGVYSGAYEVWARALGKPGGQSTMTTCATDLATGEEVCSTENVLLVRNKGKSTFQNVTNQLTSLCRDDLTTTNTTCDTRVALFSGGLIDWMWQYYNQGLRLAQLRFYYIGN
jgi:hypothetical protein